MYAILDLESTGGKFNEEGITEIAIYKFDGQKVVDQFSCLVNPERKIQPFVVGLTGINNDMLRHAPKFYEVAKRVVEITEDCVIVAHNAKFDYRLLRTEFRRLGFDYQRKTLCTVELSKKLIPDMPSYSLGKLVRKLGIPITDRHRAIGDAQATVKLFRLLLNKDTEKSIVSTHVRRKPRNAMGMNLLNILEDLPSETGVYYIYNKHGEVIYIGKSKNIRKRLTQHFTNEHPKSRELQKEVASVNYDLTGNELMALLKENEEIKRIKPKYNRALKKDVFTHALYSYIDKKGYIHLSLKKADPRKNHITSFTNRNQGKKFLEKIVEDYHLCRKMVGLRTAKGACFNYGIKQCKGACIDEENPEEYNRRVLEAVDHYSFNEEDMLLIGPGRNPAEKSALLIEEGVFKAMGYVDLNHQLNSIGIMRNLLTPMTDDRDARHIIQSFIRKPNPFKIKKLDRKTSSLT